MAIHPSGCFDYQVTLRREADVLTGQAAPGNPDVPHPGMAGDQPLLTLAAGVVTLRCVEAPDWRKFPECYAHPPAREVSFDVGDALEHVAEEGDVLRVMRGGAGEFGATLHRDERLLLALGCGWRNSIRDVVITEDPRLLEQEKRLFAHGAFPRRIDPDFDFEEGPRDLHMRFTAGDIDVKLREGGYEFRPPWHFYVHWFGAPGLPGTSTHFGIAREHPGLTRESILESTRRIYATKVRITRHDGRKEAF